MKSNNESEASKSYVSFKVTTLQEHVYKAINDEMLWAPDFSVRDFYTERSFRRNQSNQNKRLVLKQNKNVNISFRAIDRSQKRREALPPRFQKSVNILNKENRCNQKGMTTTANETSEEIHKWIEIS